ncbi:MAG: hypothetical protein AB7E47_03225 [Desulfovibrionaceae bacterium]
MMDNRVFNINGCGSDMLLQVLKLAFAQAGVKTAKAWEHHTEKGMILVWCKDKAANNLPGEMTSEQILPLIEAYLNGEDARGVPCEGWDANHDHDGSNGKGWRAYVEDWGHVDGNRYTICAIKPAFVWYGK